MAALIFGVCFVNFFCIFLYISNITPLYMLAVTGIAAFFLPARNHISAYTLFFLFFILYTYCADSFLFGHPFHFSGHRDVLLSFFAGSAIFYAVRDRNCFFPLSMNAVLVCGALFALMMFPFLGHTFFNGMRLKLFLNHPSLLGSFTAICLITALYSFIVRFRNAPLPQVFLFTTGGLAFCLLLLSYSRTSLFSAGLVCLPAIILLGWKCVRAYPFKTVMALFAMSLCVALAWYALPTNNPHKNAFAQNILKAASNPADVPTVVSRTPGWKSALAGIRQAPLLGHGPDSYPEWHQQYVHDNYNELIQYLEDNIIRYDTLAFNSPHNQYMHQFFEYGIIGLALFLTLLLWPLVSAIRNKTLYGVMVPLLFYFLLQFIPETPLSGSRMAALGSTVLFMLLGYFGASSGSRSQ